MDVFTHKSFDITNITSYNAFYLFEHMTCRPNIKPRCAHIVWISHFDWNIYFLQWKTTMLMSAHVFISLSPKEAPPNLSCTSLQNIMYPGSFICWYPWVWQIIFAQSLFCPHLLIVEWVIDIIHTNNFLLSETIHIHDKIIGDKNI